MLHVAIQYPLMYYSFMSKVEPVGTNVVLFSLFSAQFIDPEVVVAYEAVLQTDRVFLLGLKEEEVRYVFAMLSFLAPNDESRLANFGRSTAQEDKKQKRSHSSGGSGTSGRRTKVRNQGKSSIISSKILQKVK